MAELKKGDRVMLTPEALNKKIRPYADPFGEDVGTVVRVRRGGLVSVKWDGLKTPYEYCSSFVERK